MYWKDGSAICAATSTESTNAAMLLCAVAMPLDKSLLPIEQRVIAGSDGRNGDLGHPERNSGCKVTVSWGPKEANRQFRVAGVDLAQVAVALSEREEWGGFVWRLTQEWKGNARGNVLPAKIEPSFTIRMPTWRAYRNQSQECKDEWDAVWQALERHGHRAIFENSVTSMADILESLMEATSEDVDELIRRERVAIQSGQDDFDRETDHGRSRGVELAVTEKCSSKGASRK